jgi:hypothetical protein
LFVYKNSLPVFIESAEYKKEGKRWLLLLKIGL